MNFGQIYSIKLIAFSPARRRLHKCEALSDGEIEIIDKEKFKNLHLCPIDKKQFLAQNTHTRSVKNPLYIKSEYFSHHLQKF